jgi:hypothetical protein
MPALVLAPVDFELLALVPPVPVPSTKSFPHATSAALTPSATAHPSRSLVRRKATRRSIEAEVRANPGTRQ